MDSNRRSLAEFGNFDESGSQRTPRWMETTS
jgi:hypothetical protein